MSPVAGEIDHLTPGLPLPRLALPATTGDAISLAEQQGRGVIFIYPWAGRPGHPNPPNWDDIPGAHGSTPELEGIRDRAADFAALEVAVFGLSRQTTDWQRELGNRLRLPFPILSDAQGRLTEALALPTFATGGDIYLKRLTLVVSEGRIDAVFYPVPHPESHAAEILRGLRGKPL
jgi:peroxiredoxin